MKSAHQTPADSGLDVSDLWLLVAVLLHSLHAGVLQQGHDGSKGLLNIVILYSICVHCGKIIAAVGGRHVLALDDKLHLLAGDLHILTLSRGLGVALVDLDHILVSLTAGGVEH